MISINLNRSCPIFAAVFIDMIVHLEVFKMIICLRKLHIHHTRMGNHKDDTLELLVLLVNIPINLLPLL